MDLQYAMAMVEATPKNPDAWVTLGNELMEVAELDRAQAAFERALALRPGHREAEAALTALKARREVARRERWSVAPLLAAAQSLPSGVRVGLGHVAIILTLLAASFGALLIFTMVNPPLPEADAVAVQQPAQSAAAITEDGLTVNAGPQRGRDRFSPYTRLAPAQVPNWEVTVLEVMRGEDAWELIREANLFNEPPPEGYEFLLVKLRARNTSQTERTFDSGDVRVTGERLVEYFLAFTVEPEPRFDSDRMVAPGETVEGWTVHKIQAGERKLILVVDELANDDEDRRRYIELEPDVSLRTPPELAEIEPNEVGLTEAAPAALGEQVITDDWELTVTEVVRGEEAWERIQAQDPYNEPPPLGREYLLVKVDARFIGKSDDPVSIDGWAFKLLGSGRASVVLPPPVFEALLFPGGEVSGWIPFLVVPGEDGVLTFETFLDFKGEQRRFFSIKP